MISEIKMQDVASFKASTSLITGKKINLIYGLNGTGKSTLSNFLQNPSHPRFSRCTITPSVTSTVLVYNQTFIRDNFYVSDRLKGIFSLSKENKAAEQKIVEAEKRLAKLQTDLAEKNTNKTEAEGEFSAQKHAAVDKTWKIKNEVKRGQATFCDYHEVTLGKRDQKSSLSPFPRSGLDGRSRAAAWHGVHCGLYGLPGSQSTGYASQLLRRCMGSPW